MKSITMNKTLIFLLSLITGCFLITSCSDWTDDESVKIKQPENPDYARYLVNLRAYKNSGHKIVYAWFDNSEKEPYSRGQHVSDIPDSVDVVILMQPLELAGFELKEMQSLQNDKGTKVMYSISYDAIQSEYDQMVKDKTAENEEYEAPGFLTYLKENVEKLLAASAEYPYDGIVAGYKGKSTVYMSSEEKAVFISRQQAFISQITTWYANNKSKALVFEGNPQYLTDKSILKDCNHIILNTINAVSTGELSVMVSEAMDTDVPVDRFIVKVNTVSLDAADGQTGYYDKDRAIIEAAYWITETTSGYTKVGIGIYNIQNDYYNAVQAYRYAKESINIMNPAPAN